MQNIYNISILFSSGFFWYSRSHEHFHIELGSDSLIRCISDFHGQETFSIIFMFHKKNSYFLINIFKLLQLFNDFLSWMARDFLVVELLQKDDSLAVACEQGKPCIDGMYAYTFRVSLPLKFLIWVHKNHYILTISRFNHYIWFRWMKGT